MCEPRRSKIDLISDGANDSQSGIYTNIDQHSCFFVPKPLKLLPCYERVYKFVNIQTLSRTILVQLILQVNYMNVKMPLTPFLVNFPINESNLKYWMMEYIIKPVFHYQGNCFTDYFHDELSKLVRTVFATTIFPMMATPAFVC